MDGSAARISLPLVLVLLGCNAQQQRPVVTWTTGYSFSSPSLEAHPHSGVETSDGGLLIVGDGVDYAEKNPQLKRHLLVAKLDRSGAIQWQLDLGDRGYNYGKFGIELTDGTFAVSGAMTREHHEHGDLLHRTLLRVDPTGVLMQTLTLENLNPEEHLQDGFTGLALGHIQDQLLVATGFVGADNSSSSFPDMPMFLTQGGHPCLSRVEYNATSMVVVDDQVLDDQDLQFRMLEGMRVVFDETQYVVAVNLYFPDRYANEMGAVAVSKDGSVLWRRSFPAAHASLAGVQSQPYALAYAAPRPGAPRSYVIAGHYFETEPPTNVLRAGGRMIGFNRSGDLSFDTRWQSGEKDANIECYGVQETNDGGFIMTCGNGVEAELHPRDSQKDKTWMVFVARTDACGGKLWSGNFTENAQLKNNAGEYVVAMRDGRYAIYVDSQTWGPQTTGGNFAVMMLANDTVAT